MTEQISEIPREQTHPEANSVCKKPCCQPKTILLAILGLVIVAGIAFGAYTFGKKQAVPGNQITSAPTSVPTTVPLPTSEPTKALPTQAASAEGKKYPLLADWKQYTDDGSGITIYYPPQYIAKYNPNRGFGTGNYNAGSYLVDSAGNDYLIFYYFDYDGGSRREAFYKTIDWDFTPEEIAKHTLSATDMVLDGKTFLKLTTNFRAWAGSQFVEKRVFFLFPLGSQMFYFTYPAKLEADKTAYQNILTVIANAKFEARKDALNKQENYQCFPASPDPYNHPSWETKYDGEGNLLVIQKSNVQLKKDFVDQSRIDVLGNTQGAENTFFLIMNFTTTVDSSLKGSYEGAVVFKILKEDVEKIAKWTPATIPSVAVLIKVNGGLQTINGKFCQTGAHASYYASKP